MCLDDCKTAKQKTIGEGDIFLQQMFHDQQCKDKEVECETKLKEETEAAEVAAEAAAIAAEAAAAAEAVVSAAADYTNEEEFNTRNNHSHAHEHEHTDQILFHDKKGLRAKKKSWTSHNRLQRSF